MRYCKKYKTVIIQLVVLILLKVASVYLNNCDVLYTEQGYNIMLTATFFSIVFIYNRYKETGELPNILQWLKWEGEFFAFICIEFVVCYVFEASYVVFGYVLGTIAYMLIGNAILYMLLRLVREERVALLASFAFVMSMGLYFGLDKDYFEILNIFSGNLYSYPMDLIPWFIKSIVIGMALMGVSTARKIEKSA